MIDLIKDNLDKVVAIAVILVITVAVVVIANTEQCPDGKKYGNCDFTCEVHGINR